MGLTGQQAQASAAVGAASASAAGQMGAAQINAQNQANIASGQQYLTQEQLDQQQQQQNYNMTMGMYNQPAITQNILNQGVNAPTTANLPNPSSYSALNTQPTYGNTLTDQQQANNQQASGVNSLFGGLGSLAGQLFNF
jgi:hypothetical protein